MQEKWSDNTQEVTQYSVLSKSESDRKGGVRRDIFIYNNIYKYIFFSLQKARLDRSY